MKNSERIRRALSVLSGRGMALAASVSAFLLMAALSFMAVSAGESGSCTLSIQFMDEGAPIEGAEFHIYRAADLLEHGEYALTEPFRESGAVLQSQMTNQAWEDAAAKLLGCVEDHSITPGADGQTDGDGSLTFAELSEGLYLVEGNTLTIGKRVLQPQAFCVVLPGIDLDGNPEYSVTAAPKYEIRELPDETETEKEPEVIIEKEQSLNTGSRTRNRLTARAFDVVTYYLTVKNVSSVNATEVIVTDAIPQGLALRRGSNAISDGGMLADNVIAWNLGTLPAHAVRTVTFQAVTPRVGSYTLWKNMASVNYRENKGRPRDSNEVEVEEEPVSESRTGNVAVTKKLTYNGYPLAAKDAVFYVALYADPECTVRVTDLAELRFRNSSSETVTFTNLELDRFYYAGESDAQGNVFRNSVAPDGTPFSVIFSLSAGVKLETAAETKTVEFENAFMGVPSGYMREGILTVRKRVLRADGQPEPGNGTFYAGIFEDEAHTVLSGSVSENIVTLSLEGGFEASASVKVACAEDRALKLYVTETTADGTPVGDDFGYIMTATGGELEFSREKVEGTVVITNQRPEEANGEQSEQSTEKTATERTEETFTEGPEELEDPGNPPDEPGEVAAGTSSVKTGDDTPIGWYAAIALLAALAWTLLYFGRRKSRAQNHRRNDG